MDARIPGLLADLAGATRTLLDRAAQQGLAFGVTSTPIGERSDRRLEISHDEPRP